MEARHLETVAVHSGNEPEPLTGAVAQPIHLTTTFARDENGALPAQYLYSRSDNPTRRSLEQCLADLEGVPHDNAVTFASGLAAVGAVLHSMRPGDTCSRR